VASYSRSEAREWAMENFKGVVNVIIPSFTNDLKGLNEKAIRHDIRKNIELGFAGALMVSEVAITLPEYRQFFEISRDESHNRQLLVHHASWNNLADNIEALRIAEENGAEIILLSYPPNFYPESEQDIYDYTKAVCGSTKLGVMLFPMMLWGFSTRIHPSDIPISLIRRLIDDCPNIVAIKAEGGFPGVMGVVECHRHFGKEVVISCPIEADWIPIAQLMPIQVSATSDHEYYGSMLPHVYKLLQAGNFDEATRLYWQLQPARRARSSAHEKLSGGFFINRMAWKFQAWLQGYNGGPLRQPTMRIHDSQMNALRAGLAASKILPESASRDSNRDFFVGRNPT
jgi:4-hydroxy-tetrahydrodipicolinate synthase